MAGKPRKRHPVTQPVDKTYRFIALTQDQNAIVDLQDYASLLQHSWFAAWDPTTQSFYARRTLWNGVRSVTILMHRVIMNCPDDMEIDHRNGNTLDNRRENLRISTAAQNSANRKKRAKSQSAYKGVFWQKREGKWGAEAGDCWLGYFSDEQEAARAYDLKASELFGEFAHLNFPVVVESRSL